MPEVQLTPQEKRFTRLAVGRKKLTREQLESCVQFKGRKLGEGSKMPLWDCAVLQQMLDQEDAAKLERDAGDLTVEKLGNFQITRRLGEGGMGAVYEGLDAQKKHAAIKVLAPHLAKQRTFLTRFFREGQASIKLQHENIVGGMDIGEDAGYYYFAMEFVDGQSVRERIDKEGALPIEEATEIIYQVAKGLACAHQNKIIHRDIKPDNIMLTREGTAKVMDLGLARQTDSEMTQLTRTGSSMGTPYYMAPEQVMDAKRADERSDIYSLGCTWYHMVTGAVPFDGATSVEVFQKHMKAPVRSPSAVNAKIPRPVSLTIERMMAKQAEGRIQTATELIQTIDEKCRGERDLRKELQVEGGGAGHAMWEMKIPVGGKLEMRRMTIEDVRVRIRKGLVDAETPTRRVGDRAFQPAKTYTDLQREFPHDYATAVSDSAAQHASGTQKEQGRGTRGELHTLVQGFDKAQRSYKRGKTFKKAVPVLITLAVLGALAVAGVVLWPKISGRIGRAPAPAPAEQAPTEEAPVEE